MKNVNIAKDKTIAKDRNSFNKAKVIILPILDLSETDIKNGKGKKKNSINVEIYNCV